MSQSTLIVGGGGLLGGALLAHGHRKGLAMMATTRHPLEASATLSRLDLREPLSGWQPPVDCQAAILCSAITSLDACRRDPEGTRWFNQTQILRLTEKLLNANIFVVFISSNLVFDGRQPNRRADELINPMTEYGRQKAGVESALKAFGNSTAVVRLTKVFNPRSQLLCGWLDSLRARQSVSAFSDMVCAPIPLKTVAQGLMTIATRKLPGIWQFSAASDVSYMEIAQHMALHLHVPITLVTGISSRGDPSLEHSPQHTTLDASRAQNELGLQFPDPLVTLDELFVHEN